jgi:hypothetical protein
MQMVILKYVLIYIWRSEGSLGLRQILEWTAEMEGELSVWMWSLSEGV